jgi:thioredoxin 1
MQQFDSTTYEQKINEDKLTIVKYFANWCGPCKVLTPIMEDVIKNYPDINAGEVNIDTNMALAQKDGIRGVPTVVFYKNGKLLDKIVGLVQAQNYQAKIDSLK